MSAGGKKHKSRKDKKGDRSKPKNREIMINWDAKKTTEDSSAREGLVFN